MTSIGPFVATALDSAVDVFAAARDRFEHAAQSVGGGIERTYSIAGRSFTLRFAGPELLPFVEPALAHLATAGTIQADAPALTGVAADTHAPALTVAIWGGGHSSDAYTPRLPAWWWRDCTFRGPVQASHENRIHSAVHAGTLSLFDARRAEALFFVSDVSQLTTSETGSPLLRILHWWLRDLGLQLVHGGAVGTPDGGVILAGRGGSGKSTISLQSLASSLSYAADDYCVVRPAEEPRVHSLFCSGKVHADDVERFAFLRPALRHPGRSGIEKALFILHEAFASQLAKSLPIRAVIVPRVTGGPRTTVTRIAASAGLMALAPSTIFQLPGAGAPALQVLGRLTARVPCFRLDAGSDVHAIPFVIAELLAHL